MIAPSIPLASAVLCVNCSCISTSKGACVDCGSHSLLNLSAVLDRSGDWDEVIEVDKYLFSLERMSKP